MGLERSGRTRCGVDSVRYEAFCNKSSWATRPQWELLLILKHLQPFANYKTPPFTPYYVRTVSKPLSSEPGCVKTSDISLARRLILSSASLFIRNFICEYLNT